MTSCRSDLEANDELLKSHQVGVGYIVPVLLPARFQGLCTLVPLEKGTKSLEFVHHEDFSGFVEYTPVTLCC